MSIQNLGRESALTPFRRKEAVARTLTDRNTFTKLVEDEAVEAVKNGNSM